MNQPADDLMTHITKTIDLIDESHPVVQFGEQIVSAGMLRLQIREIAVALMRNGIGSGSFVGYTLPNCAEVFSLFFALAELGACSVPVFPMVPDSVKAAVFMKSRAQLIICTARQATGISDALQKCDAAIPLLIVDTHGAGLPDGKCGDPALGIALHSGFAGSMPCMLASSSGTTGIPKPVVLTRDNVVAALRIAQQMAVDPDGQICKSTITAFPLSTSGILVCSGVILAGVTAIFTPTMQPATFWESLIRYRPVSISAPPAYLETLLHTPVPDGTDLGFVKKIMTGMDFFSPSLLARCSIKFPEISSVVNGYGCMETSTVVLLGSTHSLPPLTDAPLQFSIVTSDIELDVRDEQGRSVLPQEVGELYLKGKSIISHYPGNSNATSEAFWDGWFKTGDFVRKIDDHSILLLGRKKNMIKRGGKTVSPLEVQDLLNLHLAVETSSVVGVPHQLYGEMVWAFIVLKNDTEFSLRDLMRHCREHLASYMVPDQITVIAEIPKHSGVGKVDTGALVQMGLDELEKMGEFKYV